eukprot:TRINITY_DN1408_c0_g1_i1.p1 TRINITY_DN1408_c0_g1~~TRINITY_DN1408_c0_g1_i1.p1  ORF type:complete len:189 (+),score=20.61 TRINITY_DN1408_c0_g1_i1:90-656(+)
MSLATLDHAEGKQPAPGENMLRLVAEFVTKLGPKFQTRCTRVWRPQRRVSRGDMDKIRFLHKEEPDKFSVIALSEQFQISFEAVKRILRSKWVPTVKEALDQDVRRTAHVRDRVLLRIQRDPEYSPARSAQAALNINAEAVKAAREASCSDWKQRKPRPLRSSEVSKERYGSVMFRTRDDADLHNKRS